MMKFKNYIAGAALGAASVANGAYITPQEDPFVQSGYYKLPVEINNNDIGAVYNSADVNAYNGVPAQLQALPQNSGKSLTSIINSMIFTLADEEGLGNEEGWKTAKNSMTSSSPATILHSAGYTTNWDNSQKSYAILAIPLGLLDNTGSAANWSSSAPICAYLRIILSFVFSSMA